MPRPRRDWETIENEIRAGTLSIREIGRQYNVPESTIRRRIKEKKIHRDLSEKVRQKVRTKMLRTDLRTNSANEDDIVEQASEQVVKVLVTHRKDINAARSSVMLLQEQLLEALTTRPDLEESIRKETKKDLNGQRRAAMLKAVALPTHSLTAKNLSVALKHLIGLERQAYSVDKDHGTGDDWKTELSDEERGLFKEAAKIVSRKVIQQAIRENES